MMEIKLRNIRPGYAEVWRDGKPLGTVTQHSRRYNSRRVESFLVHFWLCDNSDARYSTRRRAVDALVESTETCLEREQR
jgi:hypothetical protein